MATRKPKTVAGVYVRISSDPTGTKAGVQRQERECRQLAEHRGWSVAEVYADNDVSASNGKKRPALEKLLSDVESGAVSAIVAWHPDRLARTPRDLERIIETVERNRVAVDTVTAGAFDLSTPSGRAVARTIGAWARYETEHSAERIKAKAIEMAKAGIPHAGGSRPFGRTRDGSIVPAEAKLIREGARRLLAGESVRSIAISWNAAKVPTVRNRKNGNGRAEWAPQVVRRMYLSPRIAGLRNHPDVGPVPTSEKPIIDRDVWERLAMILQDGSRIRFFPGAARSYLLTGFLHCGRCGHRLVARPRYENGRRIATYACINEPGKPGCGRLRVAGDSLERIVVESVLHAVESPGMARAIHKARKGSKGKDADFLNALRSDERKLEKLRRDHYIGTLPRRDFLPLQRELQDRIDRTRSQVAHETGTASLARVGDIKAVRRAWQEHADDLGWRRAVLGAVVERVTVAPAKNFGCRFDPSRIDITWRA